MMWEKNQTAKSFFLSHDQNLEKKSQHDNIQGDVIYQL